MKKIRLDPETLNVQSFATGHDDAGAGTVLAHGTPPTACNPATCEVTSLQSCPRPICIPGGTSLC